MSSRPLLLEGVMKLSALAGIAWFAVQVWQTYLRTGDAVLLLLLAGEILTLSLVLLAKPTATRSFAPASLAVIAALSFYFVWVNLEPGTALVPPAVSAAVMGMGIVWQMYAKLWLGRCFGILPACRGIVVGGPYRLVRHPIYLGYFLTHAGFLLGHFSAFNLAAFAVYYALKLCRIHYEERLLSAHPRYRRYQAEVKYRLIPFII